MTQKKRRIFVPYALTATWFSGIYWQLNPHSDSFTTNLISEKTETVEEHKLIGYRDVVEYMMCNDGEYPPPDVPCHGETETIYIEETTFKMHERVANLVKDFCLKNEFRLNFFDDFVKFLGNNVNLSTEFSNVERFSTVSEFSAKHVPKGMFEFPKYVQLNRPRFWLSSPHAYVDRDNYAMRVIVVQPNRFKDEYLIYTFEASSYPETNSKANLFFATNRRGKRFYISETQLVTDTIVVRSRGKLCLVSAYRKDHKELYMQEAHLGTDTILFASDNKQYVNATN